MARYLPLLQLMRFDKPIGTVLLFWPVCWAMLLAHPPIDLVIVFTLGVILTRAAGCVINDLCDRSLDKHVSRTQHRPLAQGTVSVKNAYGLLAFLSLGLLGLLFFLNPTNQFIALGAAALTVCYPFTKRFFAFPQLILGITFNLGVIMVFVEADALSVKAWAMYAASVLWTFSYDTIYALADLADDAKIGIRSSPQSLGKFTHITVCAGYVGMFALLGVALSRPLAGMLSAAIVTLLYMTLLKKWSQDAPMAFFKANAVLGALIAIFIGSLYPAPF